MKMNQILFGEGSEGDPLKGFRVGLHGCVSIDDIPHGKDAGGMEMYSYRVNFESVPSIEINDAIEVWEVENPVCGR